MLKPASIFDGRGILDTEKLIEIGYQVRVIGRKIKNIVGKLPNGHV